jgi:hypothetical protein
MLHMQHAQLALLLTRDRTVPKLPADDRHAERRREPSREARLRRAGRRPELRTAEAPGS